MEYSYTLTWDVLRAGQPPSTWLGAALWGVALIFFIAGMLVARRLRIRSGRERKGLKRAVSIISLTIVVATVAGGVVWEKVADPRRGQQAEFLQRELGITVRDPGSLPGFRARELTVDIVAPTEIRGCELWTQGDLRRQRVARRADQPVARESHLPTADSDRRGAAKTRLSADERPCPAGQGRSASRATQAFCVASVG